MQNIDKIDHWGKKITLTGIIEEFAKVGRQELVILKLSQDQQSYGSIKTKILDQSKNTVGKVFPLYVADPTLIPGTPYDSWVWV